MNESQISVRYAKALFRSASEQNLLDRVYSDMEVLSDTCRIEDFHYMLTIPSLQPSQKSIVVESVLKDHISEISSAMIRLVIMNRRETYLPGIARNFRDLYRREKGIRAASLVTAQPVDQEAINKIKKLIANAYNAEVELTSKVNKEVIGGFILTVEDRRYDASVASGLRKIRNQLLETSIEKK
jgi:F-type H+-transporting ATPase subunit delta